MLARSRLPGGCWEKALEGVMVFSAGGAPCGWLMVPCGWLMVPCGWLMVPTTPALCAWPEIGVWPMLTAGLGEYAGGGMGSCATLVTPSALPLSPDVWFWAVSLELMFSFSLLGGLRE